MKYTSIDQLEQFDLRDHDWELVSRTDRDLTVRVSEAGILPGEHAGKMIQSALVTFRGFRLEWANKLVDQKEIPLSSEEMAAYFAEEPLFVFSYWTDGSCCELCGLGDNNLLYMLFHFDGVSVQWDAFAEERVREQSKQYIGELTKL